MLRRNLLGAEEPRLWLVVCGGLGGYPPHHHHLRTSDSRGFRLTPPSHTHLRTDTQILVFQLADAFVLACVRARVRERAAATQSRLSVARGALEADLPQCLHCLQRREGCREGDVAFRGGPAQRWQLALVHPLWACAEDRCPNQRIQASTRLCQGR